MTGLTAKNNGSFLSKVYGYMSMSLLISFLSAFVFSKTVVFRELLLATVQSGSVVIISAIVILALELYLIHLVAKQALKNPRMAVLGLAGFSIFDGCTMSVIFISFSSLLIVEALLLTALTFGGMSIVGYLTRNRDMSALSRQLMGALLAFIVISIIEIFFRSSLMYLVFSGIGIIIFSLMTMADTNRIINLGDQYDNQNGVAVLGALDLYLDFSNLFMDILQFLSILQGSNRN